MAPDVCPGPLWGVNAARHDWSVDETVGLLSGPFHDLLASAHAIHRQRFDAHAIEGATLLSIKTGGCPEDCAYCPQAARWSTGVEARRLMAVEEIVAAA